MSVFITAVNQERGTAFIWKCASVVEARTIRNSLVRAFSHCLTHITLTSAADLTHIIPPGLYNNVQRFTRETHPSYYHRADAGRIF